MTKKIKSVLSAEAVVIRDESVQKANTALRVGTHLDDANDSGMNELEPAIGANLDASGYKVINSGAPTLGGDLTNKTFVDAEIAKQIPLTQKGANSGVAELDASGLVPSAQIPAAVDEILEYADFASLPATGEANKIYLTLDDNKQYRWSGTIYAEISASLALGETSSTAYRGDRGKTAYDHSQADGSDHANVAANTSNISTNTTHRASDGKDHSDVLLNNTHRASDGSDHSAVVTNTAKVGITTQQASDITTNNAKVSYTDSAAVGSNTTHRSSDGKDHSDVVLNNTHRSSDGKNHSDVVLNNTHRSSDGTNHANVVLNDTHRTSDGKGHSDVVLNNDHRASDGKDHADVVANTAAIALKADPITGGGTTQSPSATLDLTNSLSTITLTGNLAVTAITNAPEGASIRRYVHSGYTLTVMDSTGFNDYGNGEYHVKIINYGTVASPVLRIFDEVGNITYVPTPFTIGETSILGSTAGLNDRRANQYTMDQDGSLVSVTLYHSGSSGNNIIVGLYDDVDVNNPTNRLAVSVSTPLNAGAGWQTIDFITPVSVSNLDVIWIAFVADVSLSIRYGGVGSLRAEGDATFSLADPFGTHTVGNSVMSLYVNGLA